MSAREPSVAAERGSARAQSQVARMFELVPYLQSHKGIQLADVANAFGVSQGQIVKDLNVLWFCGLPNALSGDLIEVDMDAVEEDGVVHLSNAEFMQRPLRLSSDEARALVLALRALVDSAGPGERSAVDRALAKIEAATGDHAVPPTVVDIQVDQGDLAIRERVDEALRGARQLRLTYYVASRDEATDRVVDPLRLLYFEGRPYLEAWCHRAEERRLFRIQSILSADVLDTPAEPPSDVSLIDVSQGAFQPDPQDAVATLELQPGARWVADYYPIESSEPLPDGRLRISLRYADERWLRRLVLRLGGAALVVEPQSLADAVREHASAALALYDDAEQPVEHPRVVG